MSLDNGENQKTKRAIQASVGLVIIIKRPKRLGWPHETDSGVKVQQLRLPSFSVKKVP